MRVLVWQIYGNVHVFKAMLPSDFMKIHERLKREMEGWGEDSMLEKLYELMGQAESAKKCERLFMNAVSAHLRTHETFEAFEFTDVE